MIETKNNPGVEFLFANVLNHANKKKRIQRLNFVSIYSETVDEKDIVNI